MQDIPPEIAAVLAKTKERFQVQLSERLVEFDDILCDLEAGGNPKELIGKIQFGAHKIAGVAGSLGYSELGNAARLVDSDASNFVRIGSSELPIELLEAIEDLLDMMDATLCDAAA